MAQIGHRYLEHARWRQRNTHEAVRHPVVVFSRPEIDRLLRVAGRGTAAVRNRAMILLGYRCGLRCAEVLDLMVDDVDTDRGTVCVRPIEGDRSRTVIAPAEVIDAIERWKLERTRHGLDDRQPLFASFSQNGRGRKVLPSYVRTMMTRLGRRAGLERRCHFQALRNSFAVEMACQRLPLPHIQSVLGHASPRVTQTYLRHLLPQDYSMMDLGQ